MLAELSFERLATERGDVTVEVMERFYRAFPDAAASFEQHGFDDVEGLEGRMVAETAFLLLQWSENPIAAQIDHGTAVPHHNDTLNVGPHWYLGMIDALLSILFETLPADADKERSHWIGVREEIVKFFRSLQTEFVKPAHDQSLPATLELHRFC